MSYGYGKLYPTAFTGSLYGAGPQVYSVLAFAIAHAQPPDGRVEINPILVAGMIGMSVDDVDKAIQFLLSPDPKSRTEGEEGRRLVKTGSFEYRLVNFQKYRGAGLDRSDYKAKWDRENRPLRRKSKQRNTQTPDRTPDTPPTHPRHTPDKSGASASAYVHSGIKEGGAGEGKPRSAYQAFEDFWSVYPRKIKKGDAEHAFTEVGGFEHIQAILAAVRVQSGSEAWTKERGRFIPFPANWLRDKQWLDEVNGAEVEPEQFGTPTAQRFRVLTNRDYLYWNRTDGGPRREQFTKGADEDKNFTALRFAYDCWLQECAKWEKEHGH